jgi:hypothetical protein
VVLGKLSSIFNNKEFWAISQILGVSLTALFQGKFTWYLYKRVEIELSYDYGNSSGRDLSADRNRQATSHQINYKSSDICQSNDKKIYVERHSTDEIELVT